MYKRISLITAVLVFFFIAGRIETVEATDNWRERIFYGGNANLQIGFGEGGLTVIGLSPLVGYKVTDRFHPGLTATAMYFHRREGRGFPEFRAMIYGGGVFSRFLITDRIFAHSEYEVLNIGVEDQTGNVERNWAQAFLLGGGYLIPIGDRANMEILVLFDLIEDQHYPFQNPLIRIGVTF